MYLLIMLGKIVWGPLKVPGASADPHEHAHGDQGHGGLSRDLNVREIAILLPIAIACFFTGLYPRLLLDVTEPSAREALVSFPEHVNAYNAARGKVNPSGAKQSVTLMPSPTGSLPRLMIEQPLQVTP